MASSRAMNPLIWLRRTCKAFPGIEEVVAWGHPDFRVAGHTIASFEPYRGRPSIAVRATLERQEFLVRHFGFFKSPYVGHRGWVSVWADVSFPRAVVRSLLAEAHAGAIAKPRRSPSPARRRRRRSRAGTSPSRTK